MSDGACCHECRRYDCICMSEQGIIMLAGILHFATLYDNSNPDVGGTRNKRYVDNFLKKQGISCSRHDLNLAEKYLKENND